MLPELPFALILNLVNIIVWHTGLSGALGPYKGQTTTLGKTQARSTIIHRTVRCAIGLSGAPAEQRLLRATVD